MFAPFKFSQNRLGIRQPFARISGQAGINQLSQSFVNTSHRPMCGWRWRNQDGLDRQFPAPAAFTQQDWSAWNARTVEVDPKGRMARKFQEQANLESMVIKKRCMWRHWRYQEKHFQRDIQISL